MGVQVKVQEELLEEEQEVVLVREEGRGGEAEAKMESIGKVTAGDCGSSPVEYLLCESLGGRHLAPDRLERVGRHVERGVLVRVRRRQDRHRLKKRKLQFEFISFYVDTKG